MPLDGLLLKRAAAAAAMAEFLKLYGREVGCSTRTATDRSVCDKSEVDC